MKTTPIFIKIIQFQIVDIRIFTKQFLKEKCVCDYWKINEQKELSGDNRGTVRIVIEYCIYSILYEMENSSPFSLHVFANRCGGAVELEWGVAREEREKGKDGIFVAIEGSLVGI